MKPTHPYFKSIASITGNRGEYRVSLSESFPIDSFLLRPSSAETGYVEVEADIGFVNDDGEIDWFYGAGDCVEEAVEDVLAMFLNVIVYPEGLGRDRFVLKPSAA